MYIYTKLDYHFVKKHSEMKSVAEMRNQDFLGAPTLGQIRSELKNAIEDSIEVLGSLLVFGTPTTEELSSCKELGKGVEDAL